MIKTDLTQKIKVIIFAFIAVLGLNVSLYHPVSLENFRIEGNELLQYQEAGHALHGAIGFIATFFAAFSGNSVLWLCIFIALCMLFYRSATVVNPRIIRYSAITSIIFSLMYVVGFSINNYHSLIAITYSFTSMLRGLIAFSGIALVFYALLKLLFDKVLNTDFKTDKKIKILEADSKSFWQRTGIIFLCWLPYLIVYLPGFVSRDAIGQITQALGDAALSNHHPIFITWLFGIFIKTGLLFNSANLGVILYSIFQMILVSMAFSYVLKIMAKYEMNIYIRIAGLIFFALYPVNALYAITMWKDTLFSVVLMLLTLKTFEIIESPDNFFADKTSVITFTLLCVALFLTRNNGLYILVLYLPVLVLILRKYWKKLLPVVCICVASLILFQISLTVLNIKSGSIGEALSLPLQQIARTVTDNGSQIADRDKTLIEAILPFDDLPDLYDPTISDPVKDSKIFNVTAFTADLWSYMALWVRLFFRFPLAYTEAFLAHTHGYWYPDIDEWIVIREMWVNTYGIHAMKLVPTFIDNALSGILVFRVFPAVSMLISIGFAVWMTTVSALILLLKRQHKYLFAFFPVLLLWLTCLASPVSGQFRYIYGIFLVFPLLAAISLHQKSEEQSQKSEEHPIKEIDYEK